MKETGETKNIGLRESRWRYSDLGCRWGEGNLIYRGLNICDLVVHSALKKFSFLLLHDHLPKAEELKKFQSESSQKEKFLRPFTDF